MVTGFQNFAVIVLVTHLESIIKMSQHSRIISIKKINEHFMIKSVLFFFKLYSQKTYYLCIMGYRLEYFRFNSCWSCILEHLLNATNIANKTINTNMINRMSHIDIPSLIRKHLDKKMICSFEKVKGHGMASPYDSRVSSKNLKTNSTL